MSPVEIPRDRLGARVWMSVPIQHKCLNSIRHTLPLPIFIGSLHLADQQMYLILSVCFRLHLIVQIDNVANSLFSFKNVFFFFCNVKCFITSKEVNKNCQGGEGVWSMLFVFSFLVPARYEPVICMRLFCMVK